MTERGIRLRVPFEQFWDPNVVLQEEEDSERGVLPEDEEVEEDELGFLGERQRLKPY